MYKYWLQKKYIDGDGSSIFPKQNVEKLYSEKYPDAYVNRSSVVSAPFIKDTRIWSVHSGRKLEATGFVYLQGSPYCDAEGSSQLR